jgi:Tol biopolymer transport system component
MPSFSPDGAQIAYLWDGPKGSHLDIYKRSVGDGAPVRLTTGLHEDFAPAWSPDGSTIAFLRRGSATDNVMLIPAGGGAERNVGEIAKSRGGLYGLAWKKDSQNLIVSDAPSTGAEPNLFEMSTATGRKKLLVAKSTGSGGDFFPAVSPNGEKMAFVRNPDGVDAQVLTFTLDEDDDSSPHHVASLAMRTSHPVWTSDGRQLVFAVGEEGSSILWRAQATGQGKPIPLLGVSSGTDPVVSGNRLVYSSSGRDKSRPLLLVEGLR